MVGAALLEPETYQEAALVPSLRNQAALIVVVSSLAAGIGSVGDGLAGLVAMTVVALAGWGVYAFGGYWLATAKFGTPRTPDTWGATWRVLAIASVPRLFLVFTIVPGIGLLVGLAVHSWVVITAVLGLKVALDLETRPAIIVALSGLLPMLFLWALAFVLV